MQPSKYRCTQLQYRFAVISEAPSTYLGSGTYENAKLMDVQKVFSIFIYNIQLTMKTNCP